MDKAALYEGLSRQLVDLHASMAQMKGNLERAMHVSKQTHQMSHAFVGIVSSEPAPKPQPLADAIYMDVTKKLKKN
ncbi:unnamed protein product, partial [Aphanomyces euteiches]